MALRQGCGGLNKVCNCELYRVAQAYINEKKLDSEMRTLTQNANQFAKQTGAWLSLVMGFCEIVNMLY